LRGGLENQGIGHRRARMANSEKIEYPDADEIVRAVDFKGGNLLFTPDSIFFVRRKTWYERLTDYFRATYRGFINRLYRRDR
jgi:hypothetical protein